MSRFVTKLNVMMMITRNLAELSTCKRAKNAAIVVPVDCSMIAAIGYNGVARSLPNDECSEVEGGCGCVHAEANAVVKLDAKTHRSMILITIMSPCEECAKLIINSGSIRGVMYHTKYRLETGLELLKRTGVQCVSITSLITGNVSIEHWKGWQ